MADYIKKYIKRTHGNVFNWRLHQCGGVSCVCASIGDTRDVKPVA